MSLDTRIDYTRFDARILSMLLASAAARATAERSLGMAMAGLLFWALVWFVCSVLRARLRRQEDGSRAVQLTANTIAAIGLLAFLIQLLDGSVLPALLTLVAGAEAALIIMAEKRSHLWLMIGGALALVFFAAAESRSALFVVCLVWYTLATLGLLTADHAVERESGVACARLEKSSGGGGFTFAAISLCLAVPLYLFIPKPAPLAVGQMESRTAHDYSDKEGFERGDDGPSADRGNLSERQRTSGDSDDHRPHVDTRKEDQSPDLRQSQFERTRSNQILMFVRSSSPVYLRGSLYDRFEDDRWTRTTDTPTRRELDPGGLYVTSGFPGGERLVQTIEVVSDLDKAEIHAAPGLRRLQFPAPVVYEFPDGTYQAAQPLRSDTTYSVESRLADLKGRYLIPDAANSAPDTYLRVPDHLSPRITALASQVAGAEHGELAKALTLERYLRSHYEYSFDTYLTHQGNTPLEWFLFESKRGHCEFFASALAMMLRSQGVATRVARGFSLGERNPVTGFYEVRVLDGHEWVEAFIPGRGWLMLEPTPFYPLPRSDRATTSVAEQTDSYLQRMAQTAHQIDPGSVRDLLLGTLTDAWSIIRHLQRQATSRLGSLGWWALLVPAALLIVWPTALLGWRFCQDLEANARIRRLLRRSPSDQRETVLQTAEALSCLSAPRAIARGCGETFRDFYRALLPRYPDLPAAFADMFDDARYGTGLVAANARALNLVSAVIRVELQRQRRPRVRRELRAWRDLLREAHLRLRHQAFRV